MKVVYFYGNISHAVSSIDGTSLSPTVAVSGLPAYDSDFRVLDAASNPLVNADGDPYIERSNVSSITGHDLVIDGQTVAPLEMIGGRPPRKPR